MSAILNEGEGEGEGESKTVKQEEGKESPEGTNLIVNYLPPSVNDDGLRTLFRPFGTILQSKVIRNKSTQQSLGYGFVRYEKEESAKSAMTALTGFQMENKRLKVAIAKPSVKKNESEQTNLYLSGLPSSWTKTELDELVRSYGNIVESRIMVNLKTQESKGVGFVRLDTYEAALKAILSLNGKMLDGASKKLNVKFAAPPKVQPQYAPMHQAANFAHRFNPLARFGGPQPQLGQMQQIGQMGQLGQLQQIGQLQLQTQQPLAANPYLQPPVSSFFNANGQMQVGNMGVPTNAGPVGPTAGALPSGMASLAAPPQNVGVCLFVYHLPPDVNETTLVSLFSTFGPVVSVRIMKNLVTGQSKGFGFVNMLTMEHAQIAIEKLNGYPMGHKHLKVSLKTTKGQQPQ